MREFLRIQRLKKLVGEKYAPEWDAGEQQALLAARRRHYALRRRVASLDRRVASLEWPIELGGEG